MAEKGNFLKKHKKEEGQTEEKAPTRRKSDPVKSSRPDKPANFSKCTVEMDKQNKYLEIKSLATREMISLWEIYDILNNHCIDNWDAIKKTVLKRRK